jgi:hypothetical protein
MEGIKYLDELDFNQQQILNQMKNIHKRIEILEGKVTALQTNDLQSKISDQKPRNSILEMASNEHNAIHKKKVLTYFCSC